MAYKLPELKYAYDALEPHIDARTMEIHHSKHHAAYTKNFNAALESEGLKSKSKEELMANMSSYPASIRNNGGGFFNHSLFWKIMSPEGGGEPSGELMDAINTDFGSFDNFKAEFTKAAATRFGSGWAWLCVKNGKLSVCSTPNQDNPLMDSSDCSGMPILTLDVWEHAYYLNYQNRRPDYISAFWNVVDWSEVSRRYSLAK